jgi:hypothetical protein
MGGGASAGSALVTLALHQRLFTLCHFGEPKALRRAGTPKALRRRSGITAPPDGDNVIGAPLTSHSSAFTPLAPKGHCALAVIGFAPEGHNVNNRQWSASETSVSSKPQRGGSKLAQGNALGWHYDAPLAWANEEASAVPAVYGRGYYFLLFPPLAPEGHNVNNRRWSASAASAEPADAAPPPIRAPKGRNSRPRLRTAVSDPPPLHIPCAYSRALRGAGREGVAVRQFRCAPLPVIHVIPLRGATMRRLRGQERPAFRHGRDTRTPNTTPPRSLHVGIGAGAAQNFQGVLSGTL